MHTLEHPTRCYIRFSSEDQGLWVWFQSDEYLDDYYGVYAEIEIQTITAVSVEEAVSLKVLIVSKCLWRRLY